MPSRSRCLALLLFLSLATGVAHSREGRVLETMPPEEKPAEKIAEPLLGEDGRPYPADPRGDRAQWLLGKIHPAVTDAYHAGRDLEVILFVLTEPRGQSPASVRARHLPIIESLGLQIREIERQYRSSQSLTEAEEHLLGPIQEMVMTPEDRKLRRDLQEQIDRERSRMRAETRKAAEFRVAPEREQVAALVEQWGGRVHSYILAVNAIRVTLPAAALMPVAHDPRLAMVVPHEPDRSHLDVSVGSAGYITWHTDPARALTGGAFDVGVSDTGVQEDHPAFAGINFYTDDPSPTDPDGHGTHVAGIIVSNNSTYLGTAYGLDKLMWARKDLGREESWEAVMNQSGTTDTPEVLNYSAGGALASDVDYDNRDAFSDAYVEFYNVQVAKSAGNEWWSDTLPRLTHPANAYNMLTVANMDDQGTTVRSDDVRRASSSVGPTLGGRAKPDISAPGTLIQSTNAFWPTQGTGDNFDCVDPTVHWDFVDCSGTSMAAPHIAGSIVLMEDGGNNNPEAQKAVLLNTADAWDSNDTETTTDDTFLLGSHWDKSYGWGYLDMSEAHFNRGDFHTGSLVPRNDNATEDDYRLYSGFMYDDEKATLVWLKRSEYLAGAVDPTTLYALSDLNLRLYDESDNSADANALDNINNVHQVAAVRDINAVIKVYSWSTSFDGASTEAFALAHEENFVEVAFPDSFSMWGSWPSTMTPGAEADFTGWVTNHGDIASHGNTFNLSLPAGWTLVSGGDTVDVGSAPGGGLDSASQTWRIRARDADTTPPSPNPMSFQTDPYDLGTSQISMVGTTATDDHGSVEYYFDYTSSPTGGLGGTDRSWSTSTSHADSGLGANHQYCYRVQARDALPVTEVVSYAHSHYSYTENYGPIASIMAVTLNETPNPGTYSPALCVFTAVENASGVAFGLLSSSSINVSSISAPTGLTRGSSGIILYNIDAATDSGWKQDTLAWVSTGLTPNTAYKFQAQFRNGDADTTAASSTAVGTTLAAGPAALPLSMFSEVAVQASWLANGNPAGTEYFAENTTLGTNSGWTTNTAWIEGFLTCGATYSYQVRARNIVGAETGWVNLGSIVLGFDLDVDGLPDCVDPDDDGDGADDGLDCSPANAGVWAAPGEAQGLSLAHSGGPGGTTTLNWLPPASAGTTGSLSYDLVSSTDSADWLTPASACVAAGDPALTALHAADPAVGSVDHFLVRPENTCGNGAPGDGNDGGAPLPRSVQDCGCAHSICDVGETLDAGCDTCVASICAVDPYCCDTDWDGVCVGEVLTVCGQVCP